MPQKLCAPCPLRSGLGSDWGCPLGKGGWGTGPLAALACGQHLTPARPSRLPRPRPPQSPRIPLVTPGPTPGGTQQDPGPGCTSGLHTKPGPSAQARPLQPHLPIPRPGIGPATGQDRLRQGRGLGQAVPGPQRPGVERARPFAAAKKGRQGQATHGGSDGGRGPSGTGLARGITDV